MGYIFYFLIVVLATLAGYKIGVFVTNEKWKDNVPELRRRRM
jgi:uncharacterized protein YneF (UPF0154 family)